MNKTIAAVSAGALSCVLALAGCGARGGVAGAGNGSAAGTNAAQAAQAGQTGTAGDGVPTATPTGVAAVDSELGNVDQQLGTAGGDLAQATQSPSDGG